MDPKSVWFWPNDHGEIIFDLETLTIKHPIKQRKKDNTMNKLNTNTYIVGSWTTSRGFSASATPVAHATSTLAAKEAERLAKANPGITYVVLQVYGSVAATTVKWD